MVRVKNGLSLLLWALLPGTLALGSDETHQERPGGSEKEAAALQTPSEDPGGGHGGLDTSLLEIRNYRARVRPPAAGTAGPESQGFVQLVNPFSVRKRGRFYGSVYQFHRNDNFDARNFFDPLGEPLPEYKRNQFGLSFGSFVTDKLNVFGSYDGLRINRGSTIVSYIPTPAMKRGDFSAVPVKIVDPLSGSPFEGNQIPSSRIHPVAARLLDTIPAPNRPDPDRNFVNNQPEIRNSDTYTARADYEFDSDSKLFGNYTFSRREEVEVNPLPAFGGTEDDRSHRFNLSWNRTLNPWLVNSLNLRFSRETSVELSHQANQSGLLSSLGISGVETLDDLDEGYPEFELAGYASLASGRGSNSPRTSFFNEAGLSNTLTMVRRNHKVSLGAEMQNFQVNNNRSGGLRRGRFEFNGYYTGDAFADFLLGIPNSATRGVGSDRADLRQRRWKVFVRDDWKIGPRLSVSFSLAYNHTPPYHSIHDNVSVFVPLVMDPPTDGELVTTGSRRARELGLGGLDPGHGVFTDRNDWEPRVGIAYSPLGNNRLVLRSSYQWSYDPPDLFTSLRYLGRNFPFYYIEQAESSPESATLDLSRPFQTSTPTELTIRGFDPRMRNAYDQAWQLSVQNEFARTWTLTVGYRGRKTTRNDQITPANVPLPGPGLIQTRRPNPNFGRFEIVSSRSSSSGHELEAEMGKRLSQGFSLQGKFSWSRNFTDGFFDDPSNPRNLRAERALAWFPPPLRFTLNYLYDLPIGRGRAIPAAWAGKLRWLLEDWRISGITTFQSGRPFSPEMPGDDNNDGVSGDRPDRRGHGILTPRSRSIDGWFATADFAAPPPYGFGNSARNVLIAPGERIWDISIVKRASVSDDGDALEFRVQLFNAFNHVNFERPESTFGNSTFGKIFGARESREIEIALKYTF